jgi:hypothetical protein
VRKTLLASGALFLVAVLIPWTVPARGPNFSWSVMLDAKEWFERLWPPFLLAAALASLAAGLFLHGRRRAGVAAAVGAAGYGLWFFVDPPNMVLMWGGKWQMAVFVLGLIATPVGLLRRQQVIATVGAAALAAVLVAPVTVRGSERALLAVVLDGVGRPERLMWQETAALLWWVVLGFAAVATLLIWVARSQLLERGVAVMVIVWPAVLAVLTGVLHMVVVNGSAEVAIRLPLASLSPLLIAALGTLLTLGISGLLGERPAPAVGA